MPTLSRRTQSTPLARGESDAREFPWPVDWWLWETPPASGLDNMASDLALLRRASSTGRAVLRLYEWTRPTLSFGRNEAARDRWDLPALAAAGIDLVRRPTGGRALLHMHEITWSVTLPLSDEIPWRRVYDAVNAQLLRAVQRAGIRASLASDSEAPRLAPNGVLCFDAPAGGELLLDGRKFAGSAVWRANGGYLQHGSILLRDVQQHLSSFRSRNNDVNRLPGWNRQAPHLPRNAAHASNAEYLGKYLARDLSNALATDDIHGASAALLRQAIRDEWSRDIRAFNPSAEDIHTCDAARRELSAAEWLWRR